MTPLARARITVSMFDAVTDAALVKEMLCLPLTDEERKALMALDNKIREETK